VFPRASTAGGPPVPRGPEQVLPLEEALCRRRSVRAFGAEEVSRSDVDFVIGSGLAAERTQQAPGTHPDMGVTIATAAFNVGGLEPGLYLPAAAAGYGAWLAAVSIGLAGCAFGGSNHRVTAAMRHGGEPLRHLFTVAIGYPGGRPPSGQDAHDC
jgi:hypothetical protein